ncbi:hypothetical protein GGR42_002834 [Saonia flava]|uniref:3-keto-alpha-glucoside-1,2-lyase/3-keto-2-hydroxy-glucal hydratase domain-containing protein n=1 Tax=Saonia flava TaxID=523696 RepID=A0A846R1N6_9FLAO|nr:DUF1080 domain-containing protein [Saonia flava]NJB72343.1 hypothetical protein [Saonia flava]
MIKNILKSIGYFFSILLFMSCNMSDELKLFNGESLEGWEGSNTFFRVEKGAIVGGSLKKPIDKSYYLCTKQKYENFELKLAAKFITSDLEVNGGISFRAKRVPNSNEVMGYQADIGYIDASGIALFSDFTPKDTTGIYPLWGSLVDENRPNTLRYPKPEIFPVIIYKVADEELVETVIKSKDWKEVLITANGPDIEIKINGVSTAKYTEKGDVPQTDVFACKHTRVTILKFGIKTS